MIEYETDVRYGTYHRTYRCNSCGKIDNDVREICCKCGTESGQEELIGRWKRVYKRKKMNKFQRFIGWYEGWGQDPSQTEFIIRGSEEDPGQTNQEPLGRLRTTIPEVNKVMLGGTAPAPTTPRPNIVPVSQGAQG
jgi:hypothetical protein